jgi:hypothetical protein
MVIGYAGGSPVRYNKRDGTIRIDGTCVLIVGARTVEEAVNIAGRNVRAFTPVGHGRGEQ